MTSPRATEPARRPPLIVTGAGAFFRAGDWWDHKILPLLAVYVATALVLRVPLTAVWLGGLELLTALSALAAFAALINDLCDFEDDRLAGKPNLLLRQPRWRVLAALAAAVAIGCAFAWLWRHDPGLEASYLAAWGAFALYSVPPVRLKARGGWGVAAIGLGEAALPSLVAAALCGHAAAAPLGLPWAAAVAAWSACHGTRAILWHQLRDATADALASVDTFVRRRGAAAAKRLAAWLLFPVEMVSLAAMLAMVGGVLPWVGLELYLCTLWLRMRLRSALPVVVDPVPNHVLLLQDYYVYYLPAALLATAAVRHSLDAVAILAWLALFPRTFLRMVRGPFRLVRRARYLRARRT